MSDSGIYGATLTRLFQAPETEGADRSGPRLVAIDGPLTGIDWPLKVGENTFGRRGDNDIVLAHPGVSKRHGTVVRETNNRCTIADAGSRNGTEVNNRLLKESRPLELAHGDTIRICESVLMFVQGESDTVDTADISIDSLRAASEAKEAVGSYKELVELARLRRKRG